MAAQTPRAGPPEGFAEFAQLARLLTEQEEAGAANTLQDYFDGTTEPNQLSGSILILSGGHATGARFARVKTYQGYNAAGRTWRVIITDSGGVIDADQQWFHDNVHAAAVGILHDSPASKTLPSHHGRVRIHGNLARACPAAAPDGAGLTHVTVQVQRKDASGAAAEPAVEEMAIEALFNAIAPLVVTWDAQALGSTPPGDLEDLQFLGQGAQAFWPSADCGDAEFQAAATAEEGIWVQKLLAVMGQVGLIAGQYAGPQWRPGNRPPAASPRRRRPRRRRRSAGTLGE